MISGSVHKQAEPVVLAGLRVGRDAAGVVVADHHDDPRTEIASSVSSRALERATFVSRGSCRTSVDGRRMHRGSSGHVAVHLLARIRTRDFVHARREEGAR